MKKIREYLFLFWLAFLICCLGCAQHRAPRERREDRVARREAVKNLAKSGDPRDIDLLIDFLGTNDRQTNDYAVKGLIRIGSPAVESLISLLSDKKLKFTIRENAAKALGGIKDPRAVEPLIEVYKILIQKPLYDIFNNCLGPGDLYKSVAEALGKIKDPRAIEPMIFSLYYNLETAQCPVYSRVRAKAAVTLADIGTPALEPLITVFNDKNNSTARYYAAMALGEIRDPRAASVLLAAFKKIRILE